MDEVEARRRMLASSSSAAEAPRVSVEEEMLRASAAEERRRACYVHIGHAPTAHPPERMRLPPKGSPNTSDTRGTHLFSATKVTRTP